MSGKVTAAAVARHAGVSQSAVSRVFTDGASASRETMAKVRKAAEELGYQPNVLARAMVSGRSRIIGLVVAYLENHFYPEVVEKLCQALQDEGYHVLVFMVSQTAEDLEQVVSTILGYQVDGIVAASVAMSSDLAQRCRDAGIPVVLFNRTQDGDEFSTVSTDNVSGGRRAAEFLLAGGHRNPGYIAGWEGASTQSDREAGFRAGLATAGRDLIAREIGNFRLDQAREAARRMFAGPNPPDAVFVANDHMAFGVMDVLRSELHLRIPEDISVVGYDDVSTASWPAYDLTTLRQCSDAMVGHTIDILLKRIRTPDTPVQEVTIEAPLIVRNSARKPKGWSA